MADKLYFAVLAGVLLGVFYDLLRFIRYTLRDKLVCDLLFWCVGAFFVYSYLLVFNDGKIRAMLLLVIFLGFSAYFFTVGRITRKIESRLSKSLRMMIKRLLFRLKKFKKLLQSIYNLYYNIKRKMVAYVKRNFKGGRYEEKQRKK